MKKLEYNYEKLISLMKEIGEIKERQDFQNIVCILKSRGLDFKERFKFQLDNPFSFDLNYEINELVRKKFFNENGKINVNDTELINNIEIDGEITRNSNLIRELKKLDNTTLKVLATIYFLKYYDFSEDEIKNKIDIMFEKTKEKSTDAFLIYVKEKNELIN